MARHTPGNYVPLDVNYAHDRSVRMAGPDAELLYVRSLAYAKRTRTDGTIPDYDLDVVAVGLRNVKRSVERLVAAGLWEVIDGGWLIRSWLKWNQRIAEEEAFHEKQGEHGSRGNHERWHVGKGITSPDCPHCPNPNGEADRVPDRGGESPLREGKGTEEEGRRSARKRALPDDFRPTQAHIELAASKGVDLRSEWPQFVDHHRSKGTTMKDWDAALRTWIRNSQRFQRGPARPTLTLASNGEPIIPLAVDDRR